jgi:hypothetical protein
MNKLTLENYHAELKEVFGSYPINHARMKACVSTASNGSDFEALLSSFLEWLMASNANKSFVLPMPPCPLSSHKKHIKRVLIIKDLLQAMKMDGVGLDFSVIDDEESFRDALTTEAFNWLSQQDDAFSNVYESMVERNQAEYENRKASIEQEEAGR